MQEHRECSIPVKTQILGTAASTAQNFVLSAVTRQEKELRARLAAQDAEDSEGDIGLQEGEGPSNFWGRKKGAYYEADEVCECLKFSRLCLPSALPWAAKRCTRG